MGLLSANPEEELGGGTSASSSFPETRNCREALDNSSFFKLTGLFWASERFKSGEVAPHSYIFLIIASRGEDRSRSDPAEC